MHCFRIAVAGYRFSDLPGCDGVGGCRL